MGFTYNSSTPTAVTYDGSTVNKITYNGATVWTAVRDINIAGGYTLGTRTIQFDGYGKIAIYADKMYQEDSGTVTVNFLGTTWYVYYNSGTSYADIYEQADNFTYKLGANAICMCMVLAWTPQKWQTGYGEDPPTRYPDPSIAHNAGASPVMTISGLRQWYSGSYPHGVGLRIVGKTSASPL